MRCACWSRNAGSSGFLSGLLLDCDDDKDRSRRRCLRLAHLCAPLSSHWICAIRVAVTPAWSVAFVAVPSPGGVVTVSDDSASAVLANRHGCTLSCACNLPCPNPAIARNQYLAVWPGLPARVHKTSWLTGKRCQRMGNETGAPTDEPTHDSICAELRRYSPDWPPWPLGRSHLSQYTDCADHVSISKPPHPLSSRSHV